MYPYYYPTYYRSGMPMGKGNSAAIGQMPPAGGQVPTVPPMAPPMTGTTAGSPVESVTPAPVTPQPPPVTIGQEPGPPVTTDIGYTQAYLKTQIGKKVRIEFLVGTSTLTDRIGTLVGVGISYVLIRLEETDDIMLGDIYSIKFVTFYR